MQLPLRAQTICTAKASISLPTESAQVSSYLNQFLVNSICYTFFFTGVWLKACNSMANPFVYYALMPAYQRAVIKTFCPCWRKESGLDRSKSASIATVSSGLERSKSASIATVSSGIERSKSASIATVSAGSSNMQIT